MKSSFLIICCLAYSIAFSQNISPSDIQIPSTPGMSIIGIQNTEISRPGNYTGLYTSLLSPIVSNNGTIPTDLSLEFSPYYLESRDITYKELKYFNPFRDLRISIASTKIESDSTNYSRIGIGFRTNLINGRITNETDPNQKSLSYANDVNTVIDQVESGIYTNYDSTEISAIVKHISTKRVELISKIASILEKNKDDLTKMKIELNKLKASMEKSIKVDDTRWDYSLRTGSFLEFAGAFALDFPTNKIDNSRVGRWGIWLNYTYRPGKQMGMFDFAGILRISNYSFDPTIVFESNALFGDIGASLNFRIPKTKFTISSEIVGKYGISDLKASEGDNEYSFKTLSENKWDISVGYRITDNVVWSASLSEIKGDGDYINEKVTQFLMGISASLVPLKK